MQHTGCALADRTDDDIRSELAGQGVEAAGRLGLPGHAGSRTPRCGPTSTPCARCGLLPAGVGVEGWRYDVDTGEIVQVVGS